MNENRDFDLVFESSQLDPSRIEKSVLAFEREVAGVGGIEKRPDPRSNKDRGEGAPTGNGHSRIASTPGQASTSVLIGCEGDTISHSSQPATSRVALASSVS